MKKNLAVSTGRRKTSIASVFIRKGKGTIIVNNKKLEEYFPLVSQHITVKEPLNVTSNTDKFDILINVHGSGHSSQAEACRHGISRALVEHDSANLSALKANGFLTRDSRMVERKKYGRRGARRRFQFSKR